MAQTARTESTPKSAEQVVASQSSLQAARMTLASTIDAVEAARPRLERLRAENVDADVDFFLTVVRHSATVLRPHVVLLDLADGREMCIVARIDQRGGSRRPGSRPLRRLQVAFGGVLGAQTAADCELVVSSLRAALVNDEADVVALSQIEQDTPLYELARSGQPWWRVDHVPAKTVHWRAELADSLEGFISSRGKKTRANLRRHARRLVRAHGDVLEIREFSEPEQLSELTSELESIATRSYQRALGVGYTGSELQRALIDLAARRGWLRARVLYIAGNPVAFAYGYCYRGTYYGVANSFDPAFANYDVGLYVLMQLVDGLCREGVRAWDFGTGNAEYKERLGDVRLNEAEVLMFAPSIRAVRHNAARSARVAASSAAKAWVAHSELGRRVKREWRKNAQRRAGSLAANQ